MVVYIFCNAPLFNIFWWFELLIYKADFLLAFTLKNIHHWSWLKSPVVFKDYFLNFIFCSNFEQALKELEINLRKIYIYLLGIYFFRFNSVMFKKRLHLIKKFIKQKSFSVTWPIQIWFNNEFWSIATASKSILVHRHFQYKYFWLNIFRPFVIWSSGFLSSSFRTIGPDSFKDLAKNVLAISPVRFIMKLKIKSIF